VLSRLTVYKNLLGIRLLVAPYVWTKGTLHAIESGKKPVLDTNQSDPNQPVVHPCPFMLISAPRMVLRRTLPVHRIAAQ
jgi:hypothetical protein